MNKTALWILVAAAAIIVGGCKKSADIGETVQGPKHVGASGPALGPANAEKSATSQP